MVGPAAASGHKLVDMCACVDHHTARSVHEFCRRGVVFNRRVRGCSRLAGHRDVLKCLVICFFDFGKYFCVRGVAHARTDASKLTMRMPAAAPAPRLVPPALPVLPAHE
jgi:hypothetical protein